MTGAKNWVRVFLIEGRRRREGEGERRKGERREEEEEKKKVFCCEMDRESRIGFGEKFLGVNFLCPP